MQGKRILVAPPVPPTEGQMAPRPDILAQLVDQHKTKLVIAEEAKLQTKKEYTMHQDQMKQTFEKELHMKTAELKG